MTGRRNGCSRFWVCVWGRSWWLDTSEGCPALERVFFLYSHLDFSLPRLKFNCTTHVVRGPSPGHQSAGSSALILKGKEHLTGVLDDTKALRLSYDLDMLGHFY